MDTIGDRRVVAVAVAVLGAVLALAAVGCRRDRCLPTCEQRRKELGCGGLETCKETCDKLHHPANCAAELKAFEACFLDLPAKDWTCDEERLPVPRPWTCPEQRKRVEACMAAAPPPTVAPPP